MSWIQESRIVKLKKDKPLKDGNISYYITASTQLYGITKAFAVNKNNEVISFNDKVYYGKPEDILKVYTFKELGVTENYFNKHYMDKKFLFVIPFNTYIEPYKLEKKVRGTRKIEKDELPILKFLIVENYCHGKKINPFDIPNHLHEFCMELDIIDALTWYQSHNKREGLLDYINYFEDLRNKR